MHKNIGIYKEEEMILLFNNKKIKDLSNNGRYIIKEIFGHVDQEQTIFCEPIEGYIKPDFVIKYKDETKYVSMKSGSSEIVHQEYVKNFCKFLLEKGISKRTIQTILLYQYGDGTLDGSGKNRMPYEKLRYLLNERIESANDELNKNKDFVLEIVKRTLFKGSNDNSIEADYIYHGDAEFGVVVSRQQIMKHCMRREWKWITALHIGPIMLRPHARYIGKKIKRPRSRERLEFYWPKFYFELDYISKRYDG